MSIMVGLVGATSRAGESITVLRGPFLESGSCTSIVVRWRTDLPCDSRVCYGAAPDALGITNDLSEVVTEHEVQLTGLQPNTKYYYASGTSTASLARGDSCYFVTSPERAKPTRIWVIGDTQTTGPDQDAVRDAYYAYAGSPHADVCLLLGDNSGLSGFDYEFQDCLFDPYAELLRNTVIWPTMGNHDAHRDRAPNYPYLDVHTLPTNGVAGGVPSGSELYYSWNYGNIHFIALGSYPVTPAANTNMYNWLHADLEANTNEWLIAYWHAPPYSFGSHNSDQEDPMVQMREIYVPLMEAYGVDLVLSGHSHGYERSYLIDGVYGYSTDNTGRVLNGGNGAGNGDGAYVKPTAGLAPHEGTVYVVSGAAAGLNCGAFGHPVMYMSDCQYGSLVLEVNGLTLDATFLTDAGAALDTFTIRKGTRFSSISVQNNELVLRWEGAPAYKYRIYQRESLDLPWVDVSSEIPGTAGLMRWATPLANIGKTEFYKLEASPK